MSVNRAMGRDDPGPDDVVVRRGERGWVVGNENVSELTSAMVLADLFAADQVVSDPTELKAVDGKRSARPPGSPARGVKVAGPGKPSDVRDNEDEEAARLKVTVAQLEHALASRVRVEQAIGVLAERHRLRPREAFDLLRSAARSRGRRITEIAQDVVASTANPLLRLPEELARAVPEPRQRGRSLRRSPRHAHQP
ncbi:MAG TPA: ANTAR domain-containing protein [Trebonia sp.]|jgi:hypothetical protein|nr:ANTAR domain-containing protein [Trebonia sp.]